MKNKKGLSPLVATILLVLFALILGTITMNWGKAYVEKLPEKPTASIEEGEPLQIVEIRYAKGEITKEEFTEIKKTLGY